MDNLMLMLKALAEENDPLIELLKIVGTILGALCGIFSAIRFVRRYLRVRKRKQIAEQERTPEKIAEKSVEILRGALIENLHYVKKLTTIEQFIEGNIPLKKNKTIFNFNVGTTECTLIYTGKITCGCDLQKIRFEPSENISNAPPPQEPQKILTQEEENDEKIKKLEDEISQMKALLAEVLGRDSKKGGISLHEALRQQEVDEEILTEMATTSGAGDTLADSHSTVSRVTLSNYLTEHLNFSSGVKLNRHGVRLVALLGTTGVGKTTTLAKIAAKFVLENGVNAALITADTYRISAVDQLKTYSDILGLPLEIVYNPAELNAAIERHKHKELILIDTAGRSQKNDYQMKELADFLNVNPRIEKHLVISATTKLTDAREIMDKFAAVNPEKVIITKIDETGSLGMIVNLLRNQKIALSYITNGQSVPDDIEAANADILTDLILKKVKV